MRVGVVDIGTNSTRLLVAEVGDDGGITELERRSTVTRLGNDLERTGNLEEAAQERVHAVLDRYAATMRDCECDATTAVMTSAVRDAANGPAFARAVRHRHALEARTLTGEEEARATFRGATEGRRDARPLVVIDIGGGSTELVCGTGTEPTFHVSTQIGVVRHTERHLHGDPPTRDELRRLEHDVREGIEAAVPPEVRHTAQAAIAVAGTATSCAAMDLQLEPYDAAKVEGHVVETRTLDRQLDTLAGLPLAPRRTIRGLHPDRAPTIVGGIVILRQALDAFGLTAFEASERDVLWGIALACAGV